MANGWAVPITISSLLSLMSGRNSEQGSNELCIRFASAVRAGEVRRKAYFDRNGVAWKTSAFDERAFVRKPGYMFGWDWGPRLVGCGMAGTVSLLEFDERITDFRVIREPLEDKKYRLRTQTQIEGEGPFQVLFEGKECIGDIDLVIESPELWWPNGEGGQPLYEITAKLPGRHSITKRVGFCHVELVREPANSGKASSLPSTIEEFGVGERTGFPTTPSLPEPRARNMPNKCGNAET